MRRHTRYPHHSRCPAPGARQRGYQRGSFNKEGYLRFDFAWGEGLSESAKREVEEVANLAIRDNHEVITREMPLAEAKALGAMSPFGEKYGDVVRVVEIGGEFSRELCGGTHVGSSAEIGSLSLLTERLRGLRQPPRRGPGGSGLLQPPGS